MIIIIIQYQIQAVLVHQDESNLYCQIFTFAMHIFLTILHAGESPIKCF